MMSNAIQQAAHHKILAAMRAGRMVRPSKCEQCGCDDKPMKDGRTSIQAHHHKGYDFPLDVQWLCVRCHRNITPWAWGTKAAAAKLDWGQVDTIRQRYQSGESYYKIADEMGLNRTTIHRVVKQITWPEFTRPSALQSDGEGA